jgi:CRP-like cAMP-binding protein
MLLPARNIAQVDLLETDWAFSTITYVTWCLVAHPTDILIKKLLLQTELTEQDAERIRDLPVSLHRLRAGEAIATEGDRPKHSALLVNGVAYRHKLTDEGKRQILSLHIAGDIPDLQGVFLHVMDHSVSTLCDCEVALIRHEPLRKLFDQCPPVVRVLWRETLVEAAIFREWIVNVGRRSAERRLIHMLLEHYTRLEALGLASGFEFTLDMTQTDLADALGLTPVHVNRVLRRLRDAGILEVRRNMVTIKDVQRFNELADFTPVYLHQSPAL